MRDPKTNLAGTSVGDRRLWNTYVYLARTAFTEAVPGDLIIASANARVSARNQSSLEAVLFSAFALEYRLRSVYSALGLSVRRRDGLWDLLSNLELRARSVPGFHGRAIRFPAEWKRVLPRLQRLLELRNLIAHGHTTKVRALISSRWPSMRREARRCYNAFIDGVRIINIAIGYESLRGAELRAYYSALKVRRG